MTYMLPKTHSVTILLTPGRGRVRTRARQLGRQRSSAQGTWHCSRVCLPASQRMRVCPTFRAAVGITAHSIVHDVPELALCKAEITRCDRIRLCTINMG